MDQALGLADPPSRATQTYIVTFPNGEEEQVSNFPKFAKKHKFPRNGRELQALATRKRKNYRHQTLKNRILLENYFLPGDLEAHIEALVDHYNHQRYHESLNNVTPSDVYFGRDKEILQQRERIKQNTLKERRLQHRKQTA